MDGLRMLRQLSPAADTRPRGTGQQRGQDLPPTSCHPLSGTQQIGVVFLKAASGTCRSLQGSGDAVGGRSL
jgi:hypothetical protein